MAGMSLSRRQTGVSFYESSWANSHELWLIGLLIITCHDFSDNGSVSMISKDRLDQSYILWVLGVQPASVILCGNKRRGWHAVHNLSGASEVFRGTWRRLSPSAPRVPMSEVEFGSLASGLSTGVHKYWASFGITRTSIHHGCKGGEGWWTLHPQRTSNSGNTSRQGEWKGGPEKEEKCHLTCGSWQNVYLWGTFWWLLRVTGETLPAVSGPEKQVTTDSETQATTTHNCLKETREVPPLTGTLYRPATAQKD